MIDVVIPAHKKDMDTLDLCIDYLKLNVVDGINNIYVISNQKLTDKAIWISESDWEFTIDDIASYVGNNWRTSWYYQQLLKLTIFDNIDGCMENVLICDSDTFFVEPVKFVEDGRICLSMSHDSGPNDYVPYFEFMHKLIPEFKRQSEYAGICHHIMINKSISSALRGSVEELHGDTFWKVCMEIIISDYSSSNVTTAEFLKTGNGWGRISEYELLFNYYLKYFRDKIELRPLKQIMAYKENLGVDGFHSENIGSRTNLHGDIKIFSDDEVSKFKFDNIRDAFSHIASRVADKGWDSITFQDHTRSPLHLRK